MKGVTRSLILTNVSMILVRVRDPGLVGSKSYVASRIVA